MAASPVRAQGRIQPTATSGSVLHLDETLIDQVIDALAAEGIECNEDADRIVRRGLRCLALRDVTTAEP